MCVDRSRLFETRAQFAVNLTESDFDIWVFGGVFKIVVALDRAYRSALPPDG